MTEKTIQFGVRIIYEDNHLLVAVKPHGILSQGDETGDPDMLGILKEYIRISCGKPGNVFLGLVHRLDRPAGGLMVFARTSKAASRISGQIREGSFGKEYLAVVQGRPDAAGIEKGSKTAETTGMSIAPYETEASETIKIKTKLTDYLVKDAKTRTVHIGDSEQDGAKEAVLEYEVLESVIKGACDTGSGEVLSLLKITLRTGRAHQIRAQLSNAGFPLFGDRKYSTGEYKNSMDMALWSCELKFVHPTTKQTLHFYCDPAKVYPWNLFSSI